MNPTRNRIRGSTAAALLATLVLGAAASAAEPAPFEAVGLAEGVWLMRPSPGAPGACNSLLVEREHGLLVVDAQPDPEHARRLLEAIASVSPRPVQFLVLSHAHAESAGGASAFPDSTLVIATATARDLLTDERSDLGAEARARSSDPRAWAAPPVRPPGLVIWARTEMEDRINKVELLPLSQAHSTSDLMVLLPGPNVLWGGSVVFPDRNPYGEDANVAGWLGVLNHIAKMQPAVVVPSRGEPIDTREVRLERDALAWLRGQVDLGFIDRVPPEKIADRVLEAEDLDKYFDAEASPRFLRGLFERAVSDAVYDRRKRGLM